MLRLVYVFAVLLAFADPAQALKVTLTTNTKPYPGVNVRKGYSDSPKRHFYVTFVSLCTDYVHVRATSTPKKRETCGAWGSAAGVQLAVNGDFFKYETPPKIYGDAVGKGVRWPFSLSGVDDTSGWYKQNYGWIALGDGWVDFTHTEHVKKNAAQFEAAGYSVSGGWAPTEVAPDPPPGTQALVSGFSELVIEGKVYTCPDPAKSKCFPDRGDMSEWHKRTAMGITKNRKTLIFVVTTSDTSGAELAQIMGELGAWEAFNLDGGGSSTLWLKSAGYLAPSGTKRAVANHWGVFAGAASGKAKAPGSCFVDGGCYPVAVEGAEASLFKDFKPSWNFYKYAVSLHEAGITKGCSAGPDLMFCPKCNITRREMAVFLARAAGMDIKNPPAEPSFVDVPKSDPAYAEIEALLAANVTSGCGSEKFCPNKSLTRGQAAKFLQKSAQWKGVKPAVPTFADVPANHTFHASIEAIAANCVTNGCGDDNFCPDAQITRGQAAAFVARTFDLDDANPCLDYCPPATCEGGKSCGEWSECGGFDGVCDESGLRTRSCTDWTDCNALSLDPTCGEATAAETAACMVNTAGTVVDPWTTWSECIFGGPCAVIGAQNRSRTVCSGGAPVVETQEQACTQADPCPEPATGSDVAGPVPDSGSPVTDARVGVQDTLIPPDGSDRPAPSDAGTPASIDTSSTAPDAAGGHPPRLGFADATTDADAEAPTVAGAPDDGGCANSPGPTPASLYLMGLLLLTLMLRRARLSREAI